MSINSTKVKVYPSGYRGKNGEGKIFNPESRGFNEENYTRITTNLADYNEGSFVITKATDIAPFEFVINGYYFKINDNLTTLLTGQSSSEVYACVTISELGTPSNDNTDFKIRVLKGDSQTCLDTDSYEFVGLKFTSSITTGDDNHYLLIAEKGQDNKYHIPESSFLKFSPESIKGGTDEDEGDKPLNELLQTENVESKTLAVKNQANIKVANIVNSNITSLQVGSLDSNLIPDQNQLRDLGSASKQFNELHTKKATINNATIDTLTVNDSLEVKLNTSTDHFKINCGSTADDEYLAVTKSTNLEIQGLKTYLEDSKLFIMGKDPIKLGTASDDDSASIMHYGYAFNGSNSFTAPTSSAEDREAYLNSYPIYHIVPGCNDLPNDPNAALFGVHMEAKITFNNVLESGASDYIREDNGFYIQPVFWDSTNNAWIWRSTAVTDIHSVYYFETNSFTYSGVLYRVH